MISRSCAFAPVRGTAAEVSHRRKLRYGVRTPNAPPVGPRTGTRYDLSLGRAGEADVVLQDIFIVGSPRSGTTWLHRLLAEHPDLACPPELHLFSDFLVPCETQWSASVERNRIRHDAGAHGNGLDELLDREAFLAWMRDLYTGARDAALVLRPGASRSARKDADQRAGTSRSSGKSCPARASCTSFAIRGTRSPLCSNRAAGRSATGRLPTSLRRPTSGWGTPRRHGVTPTLPTLCRSATRTSTPTSAAYSSASRTSPAWRAASTSGSAAIRGPGPSTAWTSSCDVPAGGRRVIASTPGAGAPLSPVRRPRRRSQRSSAGTSNRGASREMAEFGYRPSVFQPDRASRGRQVEVALRLRAPYLARAFVARGRRELQRGG